MSTEFDRDQRVNCVVATCVLPTQAPARLSFCPVPASYLRAGSGPAAMVRKTAMFVSQSGIVGIRSDERILDRAW